MQRENISFLIKPFHFHFIHQHTMPTINSMPVYRLLLLDSLTNWIVVRILRFTISIFSLSISCYDASKTATINLILPLFGFVRFHFLFIALDFSCDLQLLPLVVLYFFFLLLPWLHIDISARRTYSKRLLVREIVYCLHANAAHAHNL